MRCAFLASQRAPKSDAIDGDVHGENGGTVERMVGQQLKSEGTKANQNIDVGWKIVGPCTRLAARDRKIEAVQDLQMRTNTFMYERGETRPGSSFSLFYRYMFGK